MNYIICVYARNVNKQSKIFSIKHNKVVLMMKNVDSKLVLPLWDISGHS